MLSGGGDAGVINSDGFFGPVLAAVLASMSKEEIDDFAKLDSDRSRVKFVSSLDFFLSGKLDLGPAVEKLWSGKDAQRSVEAREAGNVSFKAGKFLHAQLLYSVSVLHAPVSLRDDPRPIPSASTVSWLRDKPREDEDDDGGGDSEEERPRHRRHRRGDRFISSGLDLSLALANRSACLQKGKFFLKAVEDIELAIKCGYPKEKRFKLFEREGNCLAALMSLNAGDEKKRERYRQRAREAFEDAIQAVGASVLTGAKAEVFVAEVRKEMEKIETPAANVDALERSSKESWDDAETRRKNEVRPGGSHLLDLSSNAHPRIPCAADLLEVAYDERRGRHVVATRDVPAGATLLVEEPVCAVVAPEFQGSNCHHCLVLIQANVPCPSCSQVNFCSTFCRDLALSSYHRAECRVVQVLKESGLNENPLICLRLLTRFGLDAVKADLTTEKGDLVEPDPRWGCGKGAYRSLDLLNAYHHFGPADAEEDKKKRALPRAITAVFLTMCLQKGGTFFAEEGESNKNAFGEDQLLIANLLMHLLWALPANNHHIGALNLAAKGTIKGSQMRTLGGGLYNALSLFNHSCQPCFMRANAGSAVVCVAVRDIPAGQEITENYGLHYARDPLQFRKTICGQHYGFECACPACAEDWPDKIGLQLHHSRAGARAAADRAVELLKGERNSDWHGGIEKLKECINMVDPSIPNWERHRVESAVWSYIWFAVGNKRWTKMESPPLDDPG